MRSAQLMDEVLREQGGEELLAAGRAGPADRDRAGAKAWPVPAKPWRCACAGGRRALARELVRAFSAWFQLVNVAEKVHRIRRRREYFQQDSDRPQPGGVEDALSELKAAGPEPPEVLALLAQLSIEPVLLAHPMESTRRTSAAPPAAHRRAAARARQRDAGAQ